MLALQDGVDAAAWAANCAGCCERLGVLSVHRKVVGGEHWDSEEGGQLRDRKAHTLDVRSDRLQHQQPSALIFDSAAWVRGGDHQA